MITARPLSSLLRAASVESTFPLSGDPLVAGIAVDSRTVRPGDLFLALRGAREDGERFVPEAIARGAIAILAEGDPTPQTAAAWVKVNDARLATGRVAREWFGRPDTAMTLVGVTGTKGKTTVTYLVEAIAAAAGCAAGRIGTIGYAYRGREVEASRTTPEAIDLFALLASMRDAGISIVAMEVSSHALALHRVADARFPVAAFLNLGRDHLDFHGGPEEYFEAKASLFERLASSDTAVLPSDEPLGEALARRTEARVLRFGRGVGADIRILDAASNLEGSVARVATPRGEMTLRTPLLGRFNVENVAAAAACAMAIGLDRDPIIAGVASCARVPGRLDPVHAGQPFAVLIDYAHTEESLAAALDAVRALTAGRLLAVFGCGGDRDRGKRPGMGRVAARRADVIVLTSDNPRTEDPERILREIEAGVISVPGAAIRCLVEPERRLAIERALAMAVPGDAVMIAGKGHETTQIFHDRVVPFDDREVASLALEKLGHPGGPDAGA